MDLAAGSPTHQLARRLCGSQYSYIVGKVLFRLTLKDFPKLEMNIYEAHKNVDLKLF